MNARPAAEPGRWADLSKRLISAALMLTVGAVAIWLGGVPFMALVILLSAVMMWELATITSRDRKYEAIALACLMGVSLLGAFIVLPVPSILFLALPALGLASTARPERFIGAIAAFSIAVAGYGLVELRETAGSYSILWLVAVVVVSDAMGYFAGKILGGPKFWPAISPKKTWSGTAAGWIGAAGVGAVFVAMGLAPASLILLSMLAAFAGQMGDIGESLLKRHAGVKDSSNLIPGHGGVMDRFDALTGAAVLLVLLGLMFDLPLAEGS